MQLPILTLIWLVPIAAVVSMFFVPSTRVRTIKAITITAGSVSFLLSLVVCLGYMTSGATGGALLYVEKFAWMPAIGINYYLGVNGITSILVLLTGIITVTGILMSWNVADRQKEFFMLLLTLCAGVFGVFMSRNLFIFFLFYEAAVLPKYLLIGVWGLGRKEYAAMKLTLYLFFGSALMLAGILALYFTSGLGTFDLDVLAGFVYSLPFQKLFFPILFIGFGILSGLFPFYTWAPDGHASAPTAVSMLSAGILMKLGAYGCLVVAAGLLPDGAKWWLPAIAVIAAINIVYGSLLVLVQKDMKYIAAYSSISHMGIVLLGIAAANSVALSGAVLQMFSHGILTGLLFGIVGMIYVRTHTRSIDELSGLARKVPVLTVFFVLTGLLSLGLPGFSSFVAEFSVFLGAFRAYPVVTVISITGIVITAFYILRVVGIIFFGKFDEKRFADLKDANPVELTALCILTFFVLVIGIYPHPVMKMIYSSVGVIATKLGGL
jgi:NADH-quinone oxidoreductase subunit M